MKKLFVFLSTSLIVFTSVYSNGQGKSSSKGHLAEFIPYLENGTLLILGESHGTNEAPALFKDLIQLSLDLQKTKTTHVYLEYPKSEQIFLDQYLNSNGSKQSRLEFLSSKFWNPRMPDGRSSLAMFELIEFLRIHKLKGKKIRVSAFVGSCREWTCYEKEMAKNISEALLPKESRMLLVGSLHAIKNPNNKKWRVF